jgi:hypothetical protein
MADITTLLVNQGRSLDTGLFNIEHVFAFSATIADDADTVALITIEHGMRLFDCSLAVSATLGASCTATLRKLTGETATALTAKTTAGAASVVRMSAAPLDLVAGDVIQVLIDDADVAAAATVTVDLVCQRA